MKDMSIVTLLFEPNVLEGNCRSLVSYYPPGTVLPADQEVEEQGTEAEGRKLLFWLDWHSRSIPVY
jgi:hypothetical protein